MERSPLKSAMCSNPLLFCLKGMMRKCPQPVGAVSTPRVTMLSDLRYLMRSAMEMILRLKRWAISRSWGRRHSAVFVNDFDEAGYGCSPARR